MEIKHLKFLANYQYESWAKVIYFHYAFGDMNKLVSLLSGNPEKARRVIKKSLIAQYPKQPEWVLELVARENLKELSKVFRQYSFQLAS